MCACAGAPLAPWSMLEFKLQYVKCQLCSSCGARCPEEHSLVTVKVHPAVKVHPEQRFIFGDQDEVQG